MEKQINKRIDIRGEVCPYTLVKAKLRIESIGVGDVLEILLDNPEAVKSIPHAMAGYGHQVVKVEKVSETDWFIQVQKSTED